MFFRAVKDAIITYPLTAGNAIPDGTGDHKSDGRIAATVTVTSLTSICFALIGVFANIQVENNIAYMVTWAISEIIVIFAIVALIWISVLAYKNKDSWYQEDYYPKGRKEGAKISITFLWIFGVATIVDKSVELSIDIECLNSNITIPENTFSKRWHWIFSDIAHIIFYCIQLGFFSYFLRYRLGNHLAINYGVLSVLLTNAVQWFISLMEDINDYYKEGQISGLDKDHCFWDSWILKKVMAALHPYLSPAMIEFFLLSAGLILGMLPSDCTEEITEPSESESNELMPLLKDEQDIRVERSYEKHPATYFLFVIFTTVVNIILTIVNIVFTKVSPESYPVFCTLVVTDSVFKLLLLGAIMIIYYRIHKFGQQQQNHGSLSSGQYLFLLTTTGTLGIDVLGIIGGIQFSDLKGYLYTMNNVFDVFLTIWQSILLIHIERIVLTEPRGKLIPSELLCLYLAISNFVYWAVDSFIDVTYAESYHVSGWIVSADQWENIQEMLAPMLIFYRFHTFLDWYVVYCRLKQTNLYSL
jgi:hypothetical protein